MTMHISTAMTILKRLLWIKVKTIMSVSLRKIRKPSQGKNEAGKHRTGL